MTNEQRLGIKVLPLSPEAQTRRDEYLRRSEIRRNFLVPIHIMWSSDVSAETAESAKSGVMDALIASGQDRQVAVIGSETLVPGDFENANWYLNTVYARQQLSRDVGFGPQLDAGEFSSLFPNEPAQAVSPHWDVLIVNRDLNARVNGEFINFIYGETNPFFPYSVQSVRRIENATSNKELNLAMTRNLLRHEVGHMFGLVGRQGAVESLGSHCPNVCSMKQTLNVRELAENTIAVENQGQHFCNDCMSELARTKLNYKPL